MNNFHEALSFVNEKIYKPNNLHIQSVQEELQNAEYGAGTFLLNKTTVRFRVAKVTPTKIGQFVAFWEKDEYNKNQAFSYDKAPDLVVINTFTSEGNYGQFVFPKEALLKQNILKTNTANGKMAIRVYPSWEHPTSKQAIKTQQWQLKYFVEVDFANKLTVQKLIKLYDF